MKLVEHECVNCGAQLYKISDTEFRCDYCESIYMLKKSGTLKMQKKPKVSNVIESKPKETTRKSAKSVAVRSQKPTWKKGSFAEAFFSIVALLWFGAMMILGCVGLVMLIQTFTGERTNSDKVGKENEIVIENKDYGVSKEFQVVAEAVFEKSYDKISQSELDSVSKVDITFSGSGISKGYFVVAGEQRDFSCEVSFIQVMYDLDKLRNLNALSTDCPILEGFLDGLDELTEIETDCTVLELTEVMPHPEQITVLKGVELKESTDGLSDFSNLKVLHVEIDGVKDLEVLGQLTDLEEIRIDSEDDLKGFDVLAKLTNLKKVSLNSSDLYSIKFAESLPQLESLVIETRCPMESIESLRDKTTLKKLFIGECDSIKDFSVLNTLPNLEVLTVNGNNMGDEVEWSKLTNLTTLTFISFGEENLMNELPQMQQLLNLELTGCYSYNIDYYMQQVGTLKNLKTLVLNSVSYGDFSGLSGLTGLETIDLSYVQGSGIEKIFSLPNLKECSLFDCEWDMDFEAVAKNNTIEKLSIQYCDFLENYNEVSDGFITYIDYEQMELAEHIDFVKNLKGLKELTIRGSKLENVDFVADLPLLTMLDVTNNYVSDVNAVNDCSTLTKLWLGDNTITTVPEFNHPVEVHMDEESNWRYDN